MLDDLDLQQAQLQCKRGTVSAGGSLKWEGSLIKQVLRVKDPPTPSLPTLDHPVPLDPRPPPFSLPTPARLLLGPTVPGCAAHNTV